MSNPAIQQHIQDSKQKLQKAYTNAVREKQTAEANFQSDQDAGITEGQDFRTWADQNANAWIAALMDYQNAKAAYEVALKQGDNEAYQAWDKKYKEVMMANPARPNYEALVEP
ncbi:hypothetical protein F52700_8592 [Fusarium sp. NRRL 52700]|nr:hypothetical protein F52700_8592 [Fusarium sp. NRRL 52700]